MTVDSNSLFYGSHRNGPRYKVEQANREIVLTKCATTTVTAVELASCIDENGVDMHKADKLVRKLLVRAHDEAVRKTLGL